MSTSASDDAARLLGRRPLTERELQQRLTERGHPADVIDATLAAFRDRGYISDYRLALEYIVRRAERLGHGRRRLLGDLARRGVAEDVLERAWQAADEGGELDHERALERRVRKRLRGRERLDPRAWARVYNALLREGFEEPAVRGRLERHRAEREDASL